MGLRWVSLHDGFGGFDGFGGSRLHLALLLLVLPHTDPRDDRDGFGGFAAVVAVSVVTATPLKLNPPFLVILKSLLTISAETSRVWVSVHISRLRKPWLPNRGWRFPTKQRLKIEVERG